MRTKTVKKASRVIIEKYYGRLTMDFDINKRVVEEVAVIATKRLRNKIAGFTTVSGAPAAFLSARSANTATYGFIMLATTIFCSFLFAFAAPDEAHPAGPRPRHLPEAPGN